MVESRERMLDSALGEVVNLVKSRDIVKALTLLMIGRSQTSGSTCCHKVKVNAIFKSIFFPNN